MIAKYLVQEIIPKSHTTLVQDGESAGEPIIAFFFCSYSSPGARTIISLLCSLVHQLLFQLPHTQSFRDTMRQRHTAIFLERLSKIVLQLDTKVSGIIVTSRVDALITTHMNAVGA